MGHLVLGRLKALILLNPKIFFVPFNYCRHLPVKRRTKTHKDT
jgi:hypothetical protein